MKRSFAVLLALVSVLAFVQPDDADARRLGGGRSFGAQRSFTPPAASTSPSAAQPGAASNPVMPAQPGSNFARPAAPATAPAAAGGASRWLGPIAGIAAGLGLAALFSHLGLSESFGSLLLVLLVAGVAVFVIRALLARRATPTQGPLRYSPQAASPAPFGRVEPSVPRFEPAWAGGTSATDTGSRPFPPGFEPAPFAAEAKRQFRRLQEAYDRGDRAMLADVLTPQMLEEVGREIAQRGGHEPTVIDSLEAEVLDVSTEGREHWASVRFTGQSREDGRAAPERFDEVWNLVKPVDGSTGWRLAGIQQYA
jgi:predicted lipid-binding transport protein (Tim44 family)